MKILLVDDEKFALEGISAVVNWSRFDGELIGFASNGKEALSMVSANCPDVIISDIKMPLMDGLELAKTVFEHYHGIHIILLSGHGEFEYAKRAIQYKVTDYILKPITREKINQLEELLITLNNNKKQNRQSFLDTWDNHLKEEIIDSLKKCNKGNFDIFFHSDLFLNNMQGESCNPTGIQLINFLFTYQSEINIDSKVINSSKQKAMEDYLLLPSVPEKTNFIITKYNDVLSVLDQQRHSNTDSIVQSAKKYVHDNFSNTDFNISYLADEMNISLSYLSTVFKQSIGTNLSTYIIELRMTRAKNLLSNLTYSISDVSLLSGYEDSKYFAKLFKKKIGLTPSEYRNLSIQDNTF